MHIENHLFCLSKLSCSSRCHKFDRFCSLIIDLRNLQIQKRKLNDFIYFCSSSRNVFNTSSHNFLLISIRFFNKLYVNVIIFVFQCVLDIRHNGGRSIGKICSKFSSISCTTYSFDHKANDRSAT